MTEEPIARVIERVRAVANGGSFSFAALQMDSLRLANELEQADRIARYLYDLLDAIDTADDAAKTDDGAYRRMVRRIHRRRFQVGVTDGYTLIWRENFGERQP